MTKSLKGDSEKRDDLTGLYNYKSFIKLMEDEMGKVDENGGELSIALIDVDFFRKVNDEYGHLVGDEALKVLANTLTDSVPDNAIVCRFGGEEFAIIFPDIEKEHSFLTLEQTRKAFDKEHQVKTDVEEIDFKLTFSAGISSYPEDGNRIKDVIRKADSALYRAKVTGRNKVCLSREEKMVTKTSHYAQEQLKKLSILAKKEGVGEAVLLREGLDDLLKKYDDRLSPNLI